MAVVSSPASSMVSALPTISSLLNVAGLLILRDDHGLQKVGRLRAQRRIGVELGAAAGDQRIDQLAHLRERCVQLAILREFEVAPVGIGSEDPSAEGREDLLQVLLDRIGRLLEGVEVIAEDQAAGNVHGEAHQIALRVYSNSIARRTLPTPLQPCSHLLEAAEELPQVIGVERMHRQFALPSPVGSLGGEHSIDAEFEHDVAHQLTTLKYLRPFTKNFADQFRLGDDDHVFAAHAQLVQRAQIRRPSGSGWCERDPV